MNRTDDIFLQKLKRTVLYGEDVTKNTPPPETLLPENKPVFRFLDPDGAGFGLNMEQLSKGLLLVGETGCGKTSVMNQCAEKILEIMDDRDVMVILDVKGEFADRFFDPNNPKHILFGSTGPYASCASSWNIYREAYTAAIAEAGGNMPSELLLDTYCYDIAKDVFFGRGGSAQPFFNDAAQTIFAKVLADHIQNPIAFDKDKGFNNEGLVQFFRDATPQVYRDFTARYPQFQQYLGEMENPQRLGVLANLDSAVNNAFVGPFAMGKGPRGSFTITELIENRDGRVLFIEMDLALSESLAPMYRLLFDYLFKAVLALRNHNREGNIWVLFDELSTLPEIKIFPMAMNLARSKNLKLIAALQSVSQLQTKYDEANAASLLEGFANIIAFRNGDKNTRETISRRSGSVYEYVFFRIDGKPDQFHREANAIEDWDILSLIPGEAYVMLTGYKPFRFYFPLKKEPPRR